MSHYNQGLGLYVHFPYCSQRCPYCDFTLTTAPIPHQAYLQATLGELEQRLREFYELGWTGQALTSLYFGGGTPGLWSSKSIGAFIERSAQLLGFRNDIEITLEANPAEVNLSTLHEWRAIGVNRLSLGAQSMRVESLKRLGRTHLPEDVREVVDWARLVGLERVSLDLIHGLSGEGERDALYDLNEILSLSPSHISLYQLTIEAQTHFGARSRRGETLIEPEERLISIYNALADRLSEAGYPLYEVSNASLQGEESKHNLLYWTMGEYLGIGTGAHGRIDLPPQLSSPFSTHPKERRALRWQNIRSPKDYLKFSKAEISLQKLEEERAELDEEALDEERVLVGLRLMDGLKVTRELENRYGAHARQLESEGLLKIDQHAHQVYPQRDPFNVNTNEEEGILPRWWIPTPRGREILDHVAYRLILG